MQFTVTPVQYANLQEALEKDSGVSLKLSDPNNGKLTTPDVTLAYSYNGSTLLTADVIAKHSLKAKVAPESFIEEKVTAMINKFLQS